METITHTQVQALVKHIPETKLPLAYRFLKNLSNNNLTRMPSQKDFMRCATNERRKILASQAEKLKIHYEKNAEERQEWQSGDFFDGY